MATSSYRQCAPKVELNKDRYIIHWPVTVQGHPTNTKQPKNHLSPHVVQWVACCSAVPVGDSTGTALRPRQILRQGQAAGTNLSDLPTKPGALLKRTAWRVLARWSRCSPGASRVGQGIATSCGGCGAPPWARKQGAILLPQLAGNHAKSAETPLVRLMPPCGRSCGWVGTESTGPLGARFRLIGAVWVAAPMSSDKIGRTNEMH